MPNEEVENTPPPASSTISSTGGVVQPNVPNPLPSPKPVHGIIKAYLPNEQFSLVKNLFIYSDWKNSENFTHNWGPLNMRLQWVFLIERCLSSIQMFFFHPINVCQLYIFLASSLGASWYMYIQWMWNCWPQH